MFAGRTFVLATAAVLSFAGCATTSGNLTSAAERLERSAMNLSDEGRSDRGGYSRDAQEFAREAREFRRVVEDRDSERDDVEDAFRNLSERYHALRDEVDDADSRDAEAEFKDVTDAYLDIERQVRHEMDRYARD